MRRGKKSNLVFIALICLISTLLIFYYNNIKIPRVIQETEALVRSESDLEVMKKRNVAIVKGEEEIPKYTALTEDIIERYIEVRSIPVKFAVENGVEDIDLIKGKITQEVLRTGEQITYDSVSAEKKWFEDYDRLTEYSFSCIVAGEVKEGNIIDVLINYDNGDYDVVVPKIKVRKLIENKLDEESVKDYTVVLALNEELQRDTELASKLGYFEARLYIDESQRKSIKTFNYDIAKEKLKLRDVSEKKNPPGAAGTKKENSLQEEAAPEN